MAGTDSRHSLGYLAQLRQRYAHRADIEFMGYVGERDVPALFSRAAFSILPYATMTGMSGVAILSAMHGAPIIASDIPGLRAVERDGLRLRFFKWPDAASLARAIASALAEPDEIERERQCNLTYVRGQHMDAVADGYLDIASFISKPRDHTDAALLDTLAETGTCPATLRSEVLG